MVALMVRHLQVSSVRRKFSLWGGSFTGLWWSFVLNVRCLWHYNLKSYSFFQTNVLAKFVDIICMLFYDTHSPFLFLCHFPEYKLSALQVRISEEKTLNATTQQFITAQISGCALQQESKTHPSLRQKYCICKIRLR